MVQNKSVVFLKYPTEYPVPGEHLDVQIKELNTDLKANDVLLRNLYISLDPCKITRDCCCPFASSSSLVAEANTPHLNFCSI